ncbi:NAD(P)H nitroreductase [Celerinatantimonas yamalensis]|uniref:Putative NAD(P)H nitroreductase n=1 Tax=Celerinatantimonas yamalensis TaxID=559956 RepID=A0ABW9G2I2_9GAMM
MEAIELLLHRHSCAKLAAPAPTGEALETIYHAGLKTPDHGGLKPWRFIEVSGAGMDRLADIFAAAAQHAQGDVDKAKAMPQRAPLIIIVIASYVIHPKVPEMEQLLSAGCAVHAMQMAALAQGFNGIWRTGPMSYDNTVNEMLGLTDSEQIVGFLYLGTAQTGAPQKSPYQIDQFVSKIN